MNKVHVSNYLNHGIKGHAKYEFVDVVVNDDNRLFIDPILIETGQNQNKWCIEANDIIQSFFKIFYKAYEQGDKTTKTEILAHAREQNGTRLGYGNGHNGKGNTAHGLLCVFKPLEQLILDIKTMKKPEDLPVLIPGFAEDGLSDMLTNILHEHLNLFTLQQLSKYGIQNNSSIQFWTWNRLTECWKEVKRDCYCVEGHEVLLVPKNIVRKGYLFKTHQYFSRIILERMREEGYYSRDGKLMPKKEIVSAKRNSAPHWEYDETISYTVQHNDALEEYHKKLPNFYADNGHAMNDSELDSFLYMCM